jgi:hypothetical protein
VSAEGWTRRAAPPNGFPSIPAPTNADLLAVVREHIHDGAGHCNLCGAEWVCPARLRAVAELRARGIEKSLPEGS